MGKKGRSKSNKPKNKELKVRLDSKLDAYLYFLTDRRKETKSEVVRKALENFYKVEWAAMLAEDEYED